MSTSSKNNLYGFPQPLSRVFPAPIIAQRAPTTSDIAYPPGQGWVDQSGNNIYELIKVTAGSAVWALSAGTNSEPITPYVVGPTGGYATIQSAITAVGAGTAMIYIQPGTYTENLVFVAGSNVTLSSLAPDPTIIAGVHTPQATGTLHFLELNLTSSTHILSSAAAGSTKITFESCVCTCTNGFTFSLANWTGTLQSFHSVHIGTANGFVTNSGGSALFVSDSTCGNGSGQTMVTTGAIDIEQTDVGCPWSPTTGTVITAEDVTFARVVTLGGNTTGTFDACAWSTGSASAITMSSTAAIGISNSTILSSNASAIAGAGAGALTLTGVVFPSSSGLAGTLTLANGISRGGSFVTQYVVGPAPDAQFHTIQAAVTAIGTTPAVLYIQPGTYTENITFTSGCNLSLVSLNPYAATISGVHVPPAAGTLTFLELTLSSATHILSSAVAGTAQLTFESCQVSCTNGFSFSLANWTGTLQTFHSVHSGTNNGFATNSGGSPLFISDSTIGVGTGQTMVTTGVVSLEQTDVLCPWSPTTGTVVTAFNASFSRTVTLGGNTTGNFYSCYWSTGATAAVTMSSTASIGIFNSSITSSNDPAISGAGAGTLTLANVAFTSNSIVAATLTLPATQNSFLGGVRILSGTGSPNTVVTAQKGSLYLNIAGSGVADRAFINTDGATAWTAVTTAG